jgi:hypothetical protein
MTARSWIGEIQPMNEPEASATGEYASPSLTLPARSRNEPEASATGEYASPSLTLPIGSILVLK